MSDLKKILDEQIRRVARREVRAMTESLSQTVATQRKTIAALEQRVKCLEKLLPSSAQMATEQCEKQNNDQLKKLRFSGPMLLKMRNKMGLTQIELARLIGVTHFTIGNWESGKTRPRQSELEKISQLRTVGKRRLSKLLGEQKDTTIEPTALTEE